MTQELQQTLRELKDRIGTERPMVNPFSIYGYFRNDGDFHVEIDKIGLNDILIEDLPGNQIYLDNLLIKFNSAFPTDGAEPITDATYDKDTEELNVIFGHGYPEHYRVTYISDEFKDFVDDFDLDYEQAQEALMNWLCTKLTGI